MTIQHANMSIADLVAAVNNCSQSREVSQEVGDAFASTVLAFTEVSKIVYYLHNYIILSLQKTQAQG